MNKIILTLLILLILVIVSIAVFMFIKSAETGIQDSTLKQKPESYTTVPPPAQPVRAHLPPPLDRHELAEGC